MSNNSKLYSCRGHLSTDISTIKEQVQLFGTLYGKHCILLPLPGKIHKKLSCGVIVSGRKYSLFRNITRYTRSYPLFQISSCILESRKTHNFGFCSPLFLFSFSESLIFMHSYTFIQSLTSK